MDRLAESLYRLARKADSPPTLITIPAKHLAMVCAAALRGQVMERKLHQQKELVQTRITVEETALRQTQVHSAQSVRRT